LWGWGCIRSCEEIHLAGNRETPGLLDLLLTTSRKEKIKGWKRGHGPKGRIKGGRGNPDRQGVISLKNLEEQLDIRWSRGNLAFIAPGGQGEISSSKEKRRSEFFFEGKVEREEPRRIIFPTCFLRREERMHLLLS